jgi:hypothetical protein
MPTIAKAPKTQKARKAPKAKESSALAVIDPYAPTRIYMIKDRGAGKVVYIGQTLDSTRRWKEHGRKAEASADCRLKDYLQKKQRCIKDLEFKHVPELPNGVAHMHANAFEAYCISRYGTLFDMITNPDGCNLTAGNHAYKVDKDEIERQLAEGYEWPEPAKAQVAALQAASAKLKDARLQEAVLSDLDVRANTDPEHPIEGLAEALGEARLILGRMEGDGLYEHVRDALLPKYEAMPPHTEVPRSDVVAALNSVSDRAREADAELAKAIRWHAKALLLDHWRDVPLTANEAALMLRVVLGLVGRFAETKLDLTSTNMQHWVAIRTWSADHGGKVPSQGATRRPLRLNETHADLVEEQRLGCVIHDWKKPFTEQRRTVTGRPEEASVYVLVRDFPSLLKAIATKAETAAKTAERDATCFALLKRGLAPTKEREAFPDECEAEGLVPFELRATDMSYDAFKPARGLADSFVSGDNTPFAEEVRAAADDATKLTHARAARLVQMHETNRPARKAQSAASTAEGKKRAAEAAAAAGGSTKGKKRKSAAAAADLNEDENE